MCGIQDFQVDKFYSYSGPNCYLDRSAMVFELYLSPGGPETEFYRKKLTARFPFLEKDYPERVANLFARVVTEINKMDMGLFTDHYSVGNDGDIFVIAFEHLNEKLAKEAVFLARDWFLSMNGHDESFDFEGKYKDLQQKFDRTLYGSPTLYSLIEAGVFRGIPVNYLFEENQFQWGYGKKQVRGCYTTFHIDSFRDTEFTKFKDRVGEFLDLCGLPTPKGKNCFDEDTIVKEALFLGFPVVVKPVAGHRGQGVTTDIQSEEEVRKAFNNIVSYTTVNGIHFEGAMVQKMIFGYDHRILIVGGKFAACLKRIPAFVTGNGLDSIEQLIADENDRPVRMDNIRSPLCKIRIDQDMQDFLALKNLDLQTIPANGEEVVLRRIASVSAGGVSINVTDQVHPQNIEMAERLAKFFRITALGIDVLTADISKPWTDGNFGVIELNAGPGVFMHLAPAEGDPVDVPGKIMMHLFGMKPEYSRIPIIAGNAISSQLIERIYKHLSKLKPDVELGSLRDDGVYFNRNFLAKHAYHDQNCKIILRNPKLDMAIFNHKSNHIQDCGMWHQGADLVILDHADDTEYIMVRDILPGGLLIEIRDVEKDGVTCTEMIVSRNLKELHHFEMREGDNTDDKIFEMLQPQLKKLLHKYDRK